MSDEKGRTMKVIVEGGKAEVERLTKKVDELEPKAKEHDELMGGLIRGLNKKWATDEFSEMENFDDLRILDEQFEQAEAESKTKKPASKGTVSLKSGEGEDPVETLLEGEYEPDELLSELYTLGRRTNLTPQQKRRIEEAKDRLWQLYNQSTSQPTRLTIKQKIPASKTGYLIKCTACGDLVPDYEYHEHFAIHKEQAIEKRYKEFGYAQGTK